MNVKKHLDLLGLKAEDKITGFKGIVASICFDLYGCIQAAVTPEIKADGTIGPSTWFDVSRLKITHNVPAMQPPDYDFGAVAEGKHGPETKTIPENL